MRHFNSGTIKEETRNCSSVSVSKVLTPKQRVTRLLMSVLLQTPSLPTSPLPLQWIFLCVFWYILMRIRCPTAVRKIYQRPVVEVFANQGIYCLSKKLSFQRTPKNLTFSVLFQITVLLSFYFHRVRGAQVSYRNKGRRGASMRISPQKWNIIKIWGWANEQTKIKESRTDRNNGSCFISDVFWISEFLQI